MTFHIFSGGHFEKFKMADSEGFPPMEPDLVLMVWGQAIIPENLVLLSALSPTDQFLLLTPLAKQIIVIIDGMYIYTV